MSVKTLQDKAVKRMGAVKPIVKEKVLDLIEKAYSEGIYVLITDGYRSYEEQDELYAQGRTKPGNIVTNAKGGQSNHNFGIAVDYCLTNKEGTAAYWDVNADWKRVATIAKSMGFEWGGDWKTFKDNPHLEYTGNVEKEEDNTKEETGSDLKAEMKKYQTFINTFSNKAKFANLVVDGIFGPKTKAATIKTFQKLGGVSTDGIFGPKTKASSPVIEVGSKESSYIKIVQGMLYGLKYDPNGVDGIFGSGMEKAVKKFQGNKGLKVDGVVGPNTFEALLK